MSKMIFKTGLIMYFTIAFLKHLKTIFKIKQKIISLCQTSQKKCVLFEILKQNYIHIYIIENEYSLKITPNDKLFFMAISIFNLICQIF